MQSSAIWTFRPKPDLRELIEIYLASCAISHSDLLDLALRNFLSVSDPRLSGPPKARRTSRPEGSIESLAQKLAVKAPPAFAVVREAAVAIHYFGRISGSARVATVGLNPSSEELDSGYVPDLKSLGCSEHARLTSGHAREIHSRLEAYFESPTWNRRWFGSLGDLFEGINLSFELGNLVHFDVSPWATSLKWSRIDPSERDALILEGVPDLIEMLDRTRVRVLYLNGSGVHTALTRAEAILRRTGKAGWVMSEMKALKTSDNTYSGGYPAYLYFGTLTLPSGRILKTYCCSLNLQSNFGVTRALRQEIADWVTELINTEEA